MLNPFRCWGPQAVQPQIHVDGSQTPQCTVVFLPGSLQERMVSSVYPCCRSLAYLQLQSCAGGTKFPAAWVWKGHRFPACLSDLLVPAVLLCPAQAHRSARRSPVWPADLSNRGARSGTEARRRCCFCSCFLRTTGGKHPACF